MDAGTGHVQAENDGGRVDRNWNVSTGLMGRAGLSHWLFDRTARRLPKSARSCKSKPAGEAPDKAARVGGTKVRAAQERPRLNGVRDSGCVLLERVMGTDTGSLWGTCRYPECGTGV